MMLKVAKLGIAIAAVLAWIVPAAYAGVPDVTQCFYVPQRGPVGTPFEGTAALSQFRGCPNNDGTSWGGSSTSAGSARIKVVVRDVNGNGIAGIAAGDICVLFNGGTPAQLFSGVGADSIIANSQYNSNPLCPDVRCLAADDQTDATGTAYITFFGANVGAPGIGVRNTSHKWGHYDTELPVYVLGFKINGRITTSDPTAYVLRLKNVDIALGLGTAQDTGELVNNSDFNSIVAGLPGPASPLQYWRDLDSNGTVGNTDFNLVVTHLNHNCATPNNP
jgi:hypothetical protein